MMLAHAGGSTMHRKKEVEIPNQDSLDPPVIRGGVRSPSHQLSRTSSKDSNLSSHFNVFLTLLLALLIMALTGFLRR